MPIITTLILIGLAFIFLEVFVPGGILGTLGTLCLLGACFLSYQTYDLDTALLVFVICVLLVSLLFFIQFKYILPKTKLGQKLFNNSSVDDKNQYLPSNTPKLIGKQAVTLTALSPTGLILCEDEQYEAYSQDGFIAKGEPISIVSQDNFRLIVTKL